MSSSASNKKLSLETHIWIIAPHAEAELRSLFSNYNLHVPINTLFELVD
jgi:hypothetical protein